MPHPYLPALFCLAATATSAFGDDWPTWRHDANRSGATTQKLAAELHLHWVREYPPLRPAWPEQDKMQFDIAYEPIVLGKTLYVGSSRHDCVRAIDTVTGAEKWTFHADGPVRFAPVAWQDKVYFSADDGCLYCLEGASGKLAWKFRGAPGDRKVLGNERIISTWPARGAPVVGSDGTVYFAASIWPFMGIFVHALDARTGAVRWTNDGDGSVFIKQPHNADAFAGIAPQGPLVLAGNNLLLPSGRSVPGLLDRRTGKLLRYQLAENGKRGGGSEVAAMGKVFYNGGAFFDLATEKYLADYGRPVVLTRDVAYVYAKGQCRAYDLAGAGLRSFEKEKAPRWVMDEIAACPTDAVEDMIKAGSRLYVGGEGFVQALEIDIAGKALTPAWHAEVQGQVVRVIAADDRLFAVTREGRIHCFAGMPRTAIVHAWDKVQPEPDAVSASKAQRVLEAAGVKDGYCVVWGLDSARVARTLVRRTNLRVIVVDPDPAKVERWRKQWVAEDIYGTRIEIVTGTAAIAQLPPYLASLMVCEEANVTADFIQAAFGSLRPYGGTLCLLRDGPATAVPGLSGLESVALREAAGCTLVVRAGALPGAANWTHEHADPANTRVSKDQRVKAPLGVLWFGGPSHEGILPRHGHGPQPQVIDGRVIVEGVDLMRALDIYTGRLLWETRLPGVGGFYNNTGHQPGANAAGSNFVSTPDTIYVVHNKACLLLDTATGKKKGQLTLPLLPGQKASPRWGYVNVVDDYLIGGADPIYDPKKLPPRTEPKKTDAPPETSKLSKLLKKVKRVSDNLSSSKQLVVMDRRTGKPLWTATARSGFRHNATCVGGGRLYTMDLLSGDQVAAYKTKGLEPPAPRLVVFDLKSGKELWSAEERFGTWLSYSEKHDILIEAGRVARDSLLDEPKGMRAYHAGTGSVLWHEKTYTGPAMIHGDNVLQGQGACDIRTGALKLRTDPITGQPAAWSWVRTYGCNTPAASQHLLTFRSGAAGYFDLAGDGGTGNFGGFRSSCTNNLMVAGGILTAPEYTRTCVCRYQNQTSLALVHMPEVEMWTYFGTKEIKGPVRRLGLNLGAPGDRRAEDGTLWLEYPTIAGVSPTIKVKTTPAKLEVFRRHPFTASGPYTWVASSGVRGVEEISVALGPDQAPGRYTVRLYFAEPDRARPGQRVFDVTIQDRPALRDFDIIKEAGAPFRSVIKEFAGVEAAQALTIRLTPSAQAELPSTILCGVELIAEK